MQQLIGIKAKIGTMVLAIATLGGCAAAAVSMSHKDLDVQAKTSTAIFVEPVPKNMRTVYLEIRSGVAEFDRAGFKRFVIAQFAKNDDGYVIVDDPEAAHFQMLAYVLNLEKTSPDAAHAALSQGYVGGGDIAAGAAAGALVGGNRYGYGSYQGAMAGGLLAGGASLVANSMVHDVTYMLVCDIAVKEKAGKGVLVRKDSSIDTKVSDGGTSQQRVSEAMTHKEYRTRIVTTANKANLSLDEAQDQMFTKTAFAMSGFF